ncbi:hypothetical protein ACHAXT_004309 [Thalassiosira profunda]
MNAAELLLIGVMPFLYGAATRLPFIYFVIRLSQRFELGALPIGLCVGSYQACRVVTSALAAKASRLSHLLGTAAGLAGFLTVYLADTNSLAPFVAGTVVIGFSETMSSLQKYAKEAATSQARKDRAEASLKLKAQYASVMLGVVFAFSVGGFVYQFSGINGVALFGAVVEFSALISGALYLLLARNKSDTSAESELQEGGRSNAEEDAAAVVSKKLTTLMLESEARYVTDQNFPVTWINVILCISFGIEALTIGYNLSIGPIFMLEEFQKSTGIIGIMFAVGAASGTAAAIGVTCTSFGKAALQKIATSPFDVCFSMAGIATGVLVAAIPSFPVHVLGVVILMCFNDLGATLLTELQGSITTTSNYSLIGPMGQVVRRSLNVITALTGPLLFSVYPRLPYLVAGGVTLLWTAVLYVAFKQRTASTAEKISEATRRKKDSVVRRVPFALSETIRALVKRGRVDGEVREEAAGGT